MTPQSFHPFAPTLFFLWRFLFACFSYVSLHLSPILTSNRPPVCVFIRPPPPPIHLDRVEECEEDSIEEEKEEEETPVTESDSDEQEGANETTSRYFRT